MPVRTKDIQNFVEIASSRTLGEAARKMGVTQPALSESLKRLEWDLKIKLFYRSKAGISITPTGRLALDKAKGILHGLLEISHLNAKELPKTPLQPLITLGCHPVVAAYTLPESLLALEKVNPCFRIHFTHCASRHIQRDVQNGTIDIGIVVNAEPSPDLIMKRLGYDQVCVWKKPKLKKIPNRIICNLDIFQTQYILRKWKRHTSNIINTESLELIARLTHNGLGYGIVPSRTLITLGIKLALVEQKPIFKDEIFLIYRPEFGKNYFESLLISSIIKTFDRRG